MAEKAQQQEAGVEEQVQEVSLLDQILTDEPDIDAVIILTAPLNHLVGVPTEIQLKHNKPVFYYDGDVPASLPNLRGFASGFRIYQGANPSEYTAFII